MQIISKKISEDPMPTQCRPVTIAKNSVAEVQRCQDCGCISINLGAFTVRMDESGLGAFGDVLCEAQEELCARASIAMSHPLPRGLA